MKNKKIIIAGGTGSIGQALAAAGERTTRSSSSAASPPTATITTTDKSCSLRRTATISPTGAGTGARWRNTGRGNWKAPIWSSILRGAASAAATLPVTGARSSRAEWMRQRRWAGAIREAVVPPRVWVNAASATIYRHAQDRPQDEDTGEYHDDFSVQVCKRWEASFAEQRTPFTRKIALRLAITLVEGGVIVPYLRLIKLGLGGRQGSGRQMYSWVHIDDVRRALEWFLDHTDLEGTYNLSSPGPVTNSYFMSTLRRLAGVRLGLPTPAWLLKLGAVLVGTETELVLKSRWVLPSRLLATGFDFQYPRIDGALRSIIRLQRRNGRKMKIKDVF
ncbi:DUF1731 domain-containing protein [Puia sp. P3]|uniref:DUF1731 domain-containing protein n=1 Tax=Puia sp. P3 TaxID=3423952 RepID=UPI003D6689BF